MSVLETHILNTITSVYAVHNVLIIFYIYIFNQVKGAGPGLPGFGLSDEERYMVQRFYPDQSDTIGFFLARFEKSHITSGSGSIK